MSYLSSGGGVQNLSVTPEKLSNLARGGWNPGIAETIPRWELTVDRSMTNGVLAVSGGIVIPSGRTVTSITTVSGGTGATVPTNQWFCLIDQSLNVLAKTVDDTATAWAALATKTLALSATYTPASAVAVYVGVVTVATVVPTLIRGNAFNATASAVAPKFCGQSTTGLTNPASLGATAAAISVTEAGFYAYIS